MVSAGDHWSLRMSRQMAPVCEDTFGCHTGAGVRRTPGGMNIRKGTCVTVVRQAGRQEGRKAGRQAGRQWVAPLVSNFILGGLKG
jgi:hypothetical protein